MRCEKALRDVALISCGYTTRLCFIFFFFFFQAEDGIRGQVRSRGLGDVYKGRSNVMSFSGVEQRSGEEKRIRDRTEYQSNMMSFSDVKQRSGEER